MEALIPQIIAAIPASAIPLVFVIVACWFIYWKIQSQRKVTKTERDTAQDDMDKRVTIIEREIEALKALDLSSKLAQIQTDLAWIKENIKK